MLQQSFDAGAAVRVLPQGLGDEVLGEWGYFGWIGELTLSDGSVTFMMLFMVSLRLRW